MTLSPTRENTVYLTNSLGDVVACLTDGREQPVNPDSWGWLSNAEQRKPIDDILRLPGYAVEVGPGPCFTPGPKPKRTAPPFKWPPGAAPAAVAMSKAGIDGTLGRYNRFSDALGYSAWSLARNPQSNPFHVNDLVGGRLIVISYHARPIPGGPGCVYIFDDGSAVKIGHTTGAPAVRLAALQTGNPRPMTVIAIVSPADSTTEAFLQARFARWNLRGEWFDRGELLNRAREANGWEELLRHELPDEPWTIEVFPPSG